MNTEIELSPLFAVQTLPLESTAMPAGEFNTPKPPMPETADDPENAEMEPVLANHAVPLPSYATDTGRVSPPPLTGLPAFTAPALVASVNAPVMPAPVVDPAAEMLPPVLTATAVAPSSLPSLRHCCRTAELLNKQIWPVPAFATATLPAESSATAVGALKVFAPVKGLAPTGVPEGPSSVIELPLKFAIHALPAESFAMANGEAMPPVP